MRTLLSSLLLFVCPVALLAQVSDSIPYNLQEVEISAVSKPSTSRSSTPLQVMTEQDFKMQGIQSVSDAIRRFSGVVLKDYGGIGGLKTISVRGLGAEYTTINYDGMVISNAQAGQVDIGKFSLNNISMLSLSIGSSDDIFQSAQSFALAGMLKLESKRPTFTDKNFTLDTKITTGSFGHFEPMIYYARKLSRKTSFSANVNWLRADGKYPFTQADDQRIPDRKRRNSDVNNWRTEINLYNQLSDKDQLDIKLYYYDTERGLPGGVTLYVDDANDRIWNKNTFAQLSYTRKFDSQWKFRSIAKYNYDYEKYGTDYFIGGGAKATGYNKYKQNEVYWTNMFHYKIDTQWSASFSQDLFFNSLRSSFYGFNDARSEPNRYSSLSALALQYKTERVNMTATALNTYIHQKIVNKGTKTTHRKLSPSFSASVKPLEHVDWRVRASYKHVYRIPTFNETYFVTMGKGLKPESSSQYNIGTTWVGSFVDNPLNYINISLDGYYNDVKDKIIIIPRLPFPTALNNDRVKMKGMDAKITGNISLLNDINIDLTAVYSFMRAYDDDKKNKQSYKGQLPYTPKHSGSVSLTVNNPWVSLTYSVIASGTRYTNQENNEDTKHESFTDHSFTAFKELKINNYKLYATASLLNVFNKNYSVIKYYPMPGRSFKISVGCSF